MNSTNSTQNTLAAGCFAYLPMVRVKNDGLRHTCVKAGMVGEVTHVNEATNMVSVALDDLPGAYYGFDASELEIMEIDFSL